MPDLRHLDETTTLHSLCIFNVTYKMYTYLVYNKCLKDPGHDPKEKNKLTHFSYLIKVFIAR